MSSAWQSKKANFDASHELEELLLEDNPLRARQRKERDISSLSAEMRQMEEQYVIPCSPASVSEGCSLTCRILTLTTPSRFTPYDFKKMHRRSYYPQTQIISTVTATSSTGPASSRPVTPMTIANDGVQDYSYNQKPINDDMGMGMTESPVVEMADLSEKGQ